MIKGSEIVPTQTIEDISLENRKAMYDAAADAIAVFLSNLPTGMSVEEAMNIFGEWIGWVFKIEMGESSSDAKAEERENHRGFTLRYRVRSHEDYNESVERVSLLVQEAVDGHPGEEIHLMLEIEGHEGPYGGFDRDMFQFQIHYVLEVLMGCITSATTPLCEFGPFEESEDRQAKAGLEHPRARKCRISDSIVFSAP